MSARFIVGDCLDVLASLEPASVDLVMTSPPFLALRSYLPADHPDKAREIGSEATPGEFIDTMLDVVEACARVLAPHGSLVFELGDTYAGSGGAGGDYTEGGLRDGAPGFDGSARKGREFRPPPVDGKVTDRKRTFRTQPRDGYSGGGKGWPLDKSKVLIPQLFAIALAYGFNPLTGRETEPWRVRNTVAWCRPNPPVGRDGDKFRPATSFLTVACKARDRYWDGDAVRTPVQHPNQKATGRAGTRDSKGNSDGVSGQGLGDYDGSMSAGAPLLDWWQIPTFGFPGAHYATFPPALVVPVVKSMCPARVCRVCGKPSERITERDAEAVATNIERRDGRAKDGRGDEYGTAFSSDRYESVSVETLGWSDCGHNHWRPGRVLDPFAGSGTTLQVATGHGRDAIGIDLDARNAELAVERIGGLFLTVEHFGEQSATTGPNIVDVGNSRFRAGYDRRDGRKTMQAEDYGAPLPKRSAS